MTEKKLFSILLFFIFVASFGFSQESAAVFPPQAIILASYRGDDITVRQLLAAGVDKDVRDALGATALHAAMFQTNVAVVKLLLDYGYDPDVRATRNGGTPLHYAVSSNNLEAARLLLKYSANRNIRNFDGLTPLDKARREEKTDMAKLLYR